jgi:hypothetical protein
MKVCELIKEGTGFPKLLNDEAVIPFLLAKGHLWKKSGTTVFPAVPKSG